MKNKPDFVATAVLIELVNEWRRKNPTWTRVGQRVRDYCAKDLERVISQSRIAENETDPR